MNGKLKTYREKREFRKTAEPAGDRPARPHDRPVWVIQKHDASQLHYDFRLEIDGVLKSWAVPKGPSTDPSQKRLAVETEDHPLDYANFEGVIPEGEYGGGTVMVWDCGCYRNLREEKGGDGTDMASAFNEGRIEVWLDEGSKIGGGYALRHFKTEGDKRQWLLIKERDEAADARRNPVSTEPRSSMTGRDLDEIEAQGGAKRQ